MGPTEIVFIFVIYLLFFGAKGIPSLAKTIGKATYQFREARNDIQREIMSSAKGITDSANEVRNEVEKAAQLAQRQAKNAQDTLKKSAQPNKPVAPEIKEPPNPHTPTDSITTNAPKKKSSDKSEDDEQLT